MPFSNDRLSLNNPTTRPSYNPKPTSHGVLEPIQGPNPIFTESFTGTNGSAAPSPWVTNTFGGTQNIQSNQWRMVSPGGYTGTALVFGTTNYADGDFQITLTINNPRLEQYPAIMARGTTWDSPFAEPNVGYICWLDVLGNNIHLAEYAASVATTDLSTPFVAAAGGSYHMRLQCVGTRIRMALWPAGTQQDHWDLEMTDGTYTTGKWGFRDQTNTLNCQANWDDFIFDDFTTPGGGTAYTDSVTTTIVTDTSATFDILNMFESVVTTGVGVTSELDTAAFLDSLTTTGVGVTSETDVAAFQDSPVTTSVGVTSETDLLSMFETPVTTAVGLTGEVDQLSLFEAVFTTAVGVTSDVDSAAYTESPTTVAAGITSDTDVATFQDAPTTSITALTGEADLLSMFETPTTTAVGVTSDADQLSMFEFPVTTGVGSTSETDSATLQDALLTVAIVDTSEDDVFNGTPTPGAVFLYQSGPWKVMGRL